jgi:hypothetical protein
MTELTEQQIEQAIAAFGNYAVAERMRRAAPFLQLPWDEPTEEEIDNAGRRGIESALREFVRRRNAALQPKPVDPRREKIRNVLALGVDAGEPYITNATERILAVIDEV